MLHVKHRESEIPIHRPWVRSPFYLLCERIAIAYSSPDREAHHAPNRQPAHQAEARDGGRDVHVLAAALEPRIVRERRRRHHAHARNVAVREAEEQDDEHEQRVGADDRAAARGRRGRPLHVAHQEERDEECAEQRESEQAACGPDVQPRQRADGAAGEIPDVEHQEVDGAEQQWVHGRVC